MREKRGFTLIEILVVFGILAIISVVASNMFFAVLRGTTKTKSMQLIKQNGDYAISLMVRMIRNARSISTYTPSSLTIINPDGGTTIFSCVNNVITSNSASLISTEVKVVSCIAVFTVTDGEPGISPDTVAIDFDLSQVGVTDRPEEQAQVKFKTTVSLRNY